MIMKKILLMGLLSVMLSGCIIDIGGIIDIMTTSSSNDKTSQIISSYTIPHKTKQFKKL